MEDWYRPGASFEYKMRCIVREEECKEVAMHFHNVYIAEYKVAPEGVLDKYYVRNNIEGGNGHLKRD